MGVDLKISSVVSLNRLDDLSSLQLHEMHLDLQRWILSLTIALESVNEVSAGRIGLSNLQNEGLKAFLGLMKMRLPADFFDVIKSEDIVEIYLVDFSTGGLKQTWRNWLFLSMCSYDLITLMTKPMEQLFERDEEIQKTIVERIQGLFINPTTQSCRIPAHIMTEKLDQKNRRFLITNRYCAPVFDHDGAVIGVVATLDAKPLGSAYAHLPNVEPLIPAHHALDILG